MSTTQATSAHTTSTSHMNTTARPRGKTKVIVRKLPYNLSEEDFKKTIESYLTQINFYYYQPGKKTLTRDIPSRAYLNFVSFDALHKFHQMYNGHAFVDSKGIEHKAVLEWAPYQRVELAATAPRDPLLNTIGTEPDYIAFVQGPPPEEHKRAMSVPPVPPTSTPLLDELRAKAQKQRQRQAERNARRNNRRGGKRESAPNNSNTSNSNSGGANNSNNLHKRVLKKNAAQSGQTSQNGGQSQAAENAPKKSQRRDRSRKGNNKPKPVPPKSSTAVVPPAPATVVPPVPVTPKLLSRPKISVNSAEFVPKQHVTPPPAQYKNFLE